MEPKRILVVDDEEPIRELARQILEDCGCYVETVANGQEALEKIESANFDLILLDDLMPVMTGTQLYLMLRFELDVRTPILFSSGTMGKLKGEMQAEWNKTSNMQRKTLDIMSTKPWPIAELCEKSGQMMGVSLKMPVPEARVEEQHSNVGNFPPAKQPKILIVDGDPDYILSLTERLIYEGYDVDVAENAEEALDKIKDVDLILSEDDLSGMGGIEFLEACKKRYGYEGLFWIVSEYHKDNIVPYAHKVGVEPNRYILKAYDTNNLVADIGLTLKGVAAKSTPSAGPTLS